MRNLELQQLEQNIKYSQKAIDLGDALERLRSNKDFKAIFVNGYFEQEAVRLVHLKSNLNMQSNESQQSILRQMDAIGTVSDYLNTILTRAEMARRTIMADEATRDELLSEVN